MSNPVEEFQEELAFLTERFSRCCERGCLAKLHKKPVRIEPGLLEPTPVKYNRNTKDIVVLKIFPSSFDSVTPDSAESFLERIQGIQEPISFEIIGSSSHVTFQVVVQKRDRRIVEGAFGAICEHSYLKQASDILFTRYEEMTSEAEKDPPGRMEFQFNDYYLPPPYYFPLNTPGRDFSRDTIDSIIAILSQLKPEEIGFYQAVFTPVKKYNWSKVSRTLLAMKIQEKEMGVKNVYVEEAYNQHIPIPTVVSVGKEFHPVLDDRELKEHTAKALEKTRDDKPFFGVSLRMGVFSYKQRAVGILKTLTNALNIVVPGSRQIRFLTRKDYYKASIPENLHYYIFFNRVSLREGMLLTSKELSGLVHLPVQETLKKGYPLEKAKGRHPVPAFLTKKGPGRIVLGTAHYRGEEQTVTLSHEDRLKHFHFIGQTGSGKSTIIENCILQDIEQGTGLCLIEPHGDLIDKIILPKIPPEHRDRVIYFDPIESPIRINIFEVAQGENTSVIADDIISIFKRLNPVGASSSWGVQIDQVLSHGVLAILKNKEGGHIGTLKDFLLKKDFRDEYIKGIEAGYVREFWEEQFKVGFRRDAPITALRRLDPLLRREELARMLSHKKSSISFRRIMDEGKILLVKLSPKIGSTEAYMLGSLISARMLSAAMTREDIPEKDRKPFYLYIDECHNFLFKSLQETLTGARKFGLGLVLAHHFIGQLYESDETLAKAIMQNPRIKVSLSVGDEDAVKLAKGFAHYKAEDFLKLKLGEAIGKVGSSEDDFEITTTYTKPPGGAKEVREELIKQTQERYGLDEDTPKENVPENEVTPLGQSPGTIPFQHTDKDTPLSTKPAITLDEETFLRFIADITELIPLRDIYDRLPFGSTKCSKIQENLIKRELITATNVPPLGGATRKSKILTLTPKGHQALNIPIPQGKGGPFHQFMQKIIMHHAQQKGYEAIIEEQSAEGTQVDIGLTKDGRKIAIEISVKTKPGQVMSSLPFNFVGGYDEVILLFTEPRVLIRTKELISESDLKDKKIALKLIHEYEAVL